MSDDYGLLKILKGAISGGADVIQLRDKRWPLDKAVNLARRIKEVCHQANVPFIVNDRCEVALAVDADGIHIGQEDISIRVVRHLIGDNKLVGVSVHTLTEAIRAKRQKADYLGVGPVFETPLKEGKKSLSLRLLDKMKKVGLPIVAIGGINCENVRVLTGRDIRTVAVIRAISCARDPYKATRALKEVLEHV